MVHIREIKQIDCSDWDGLVKEVYGRPYCFQQQDGCKERGVSYLDVPCEWYGIEHEKEVPAEAGYTSDYPSPVSLAIWLSREPSDPLEGEEYDHERDLWWEREFYPDINELANDLHERGHLPAGSYQIVIDW